MIRKYGAIALTLLLLLPLLFAAAAGEDPATPTDLECAHEHTKVTIYFYDGPVYTPISSASHRVSGPAEIETACLDCGAVLDVRETENAEEIRPHSMKNGVCALCGYRNRASASTAAPQDMPGEKTLFAQKDTENEHLLTLTLSEEDFLALQNAGIVTALIRSETGDSAVALNVDETLACLRDSGNKLYTEMAEQEDGSLFAGLFLIPGPGEPVAPEEIDISLRFYQQSHSPLRISLSPADSEDLLETDSVWDEHGFWVVPYTGEGTYLLLR